MIFEIQTKEQFQEAALATFHHQMQMCVPYAQYVNLLGIDVQQFEDIPFMPIEFFKTHRIYGSTSEPETVFTSSGTTGTDVSHHYVSSLKLYTESFTRGFESFYGSASNYSIFALLPSYMERQGSSLTLMVERLHAQNPTKGGFYLDDFEALDEQLSRAHSAGEKIILIGVTFALLDFAERFHTDLSGAVIMETGGMKGRRREVARDELHAVLCEAFNVNTIHSEYGMTEMLSQCYSDGKGVFRCPNWVQVSVRSLQNPLSGAKSYGGLNVIDLANIDSCSFLATGDSGVVYDDGSFVVHGRIQGELLRGCNMLTE